MPSPTSPMSECRKRGVHYTVKGIRDGRPYGVECMICGLSGNLEDVRKQPCTPSDSVPRDLKPVSPCANEMDQASVDVARRLQFTPDEHDRMLARQLKELEEEQRQLERLIILQQLEKEETTLMGLVNQKKALEHENKNPPRMPATPQASALHKIPHVQLEAISSEEFPQASPAPAVSNNSASVGLLYGALAKACHVIAVGSRS